MLISKTILLRVAPCAAKSVVTRRMPLSASSILNHKESSSHMDNDVDKHKLDSLRKQQSGSGHWKRELASDSEEAVKADKQQYSAKESMEALQERTKRAAEDANRSGTSHQEGM